MSDVTIREADLVRLTNGSEATVIQVHRSTDSAPEFTVEICGTRHVTERIPLEQIKEVIFQTD